MRHATSSRRSRNRNHNGGGNSHNGGGRRSNQNRMQVFDSNGPDVRIRGTAYQICEKYLALAKDAASGGDSIVAESYLQHAEHYQRIINSWQAENPQPQPDARQAYGAPQDGQPDSEDDLGLPSSILGGKPEARPQSGQLEVAAEDEYEQA